MHDAGATPSPEADPGRYESGELTLEERRNSESEEGDKD